MAKENINKKNITEKEINIKETKALVPPIVSITPKIQTAEGWKRAMLKKKKMKRVKT